MFYYEIEFPDCAPSEAVTEKIKKRLEKLNKHFNRITSCHVAVRIPHKHKGKRFYHIHIRVEVPGKNFIVDREPEQDDSHTVIDLAIRDAFDKINRQLEEFGNARVKKSHTPPPEPEATSA